MRAFGFSISITIATLVYRALAMGVSAGLMLFSGSAIAQVTPDGSVSTTVTQSGNHFTIDNGNRAGNNLFHSFDEFSVPTGGSAIFNNAVDVQNIFGRVTGGSLSSIDGLIRANGTANLFLLNPSGIVFGANASLNIGGSFIGTTADSIEFADSTDFSAVGAAAVPLLTMSAPVGLQMGQNPAAIQVQGTGHRLAASGSVTAPYFPYAPYAGLKVRPYQTLALVGGDITLTGGILQAPGSRVELGSVAQAGLVSLQAINQGFATQYADISRFGAIALTQQSLIEVGGGLPGNVQIQGGRVTFQDGSLVYNTNFGPAVAGTITVSAAQNITLQDALAKRNLLGGIVQDNFGPVGGGQIAIHTPELLVRSGGTIFGRNYGAGAGATLNFNTDRLTVTGYVAGAPDVFSRIGTLASAAGKGGDVVVSTRLLSATEGGFIGSINFLNGSGAGNVFVNADQIDIREISPANIASQLGSYNLASAGRSGQLTVNARRLNVVDGGNLGTSSVSAGDAGNLLINVSESVEVRGTGGPNAYKSLIASAVPLPLPIYQQLFGLPPIPSGAGGNIALNTPLLIVRDSGLISVSNFGTNRAGTITVNADNVRLENDAGITAFNLSGSGGDIEINSNQIVLNNGSVIEATAFGRNNSGSGGNIEINSPIILGANDSDILANATRGRGGNIDITTQGIFGLKFRNQRTVENDITASSEFNVDGTVEINNIGVSPDAALVDLSANFSNPDQQVAQRCGASQASSFVVTGRGGLPTDPFAQLGSETLWHDFRGLASAESTDLEDDATPAMSLSPQRQSISAHTTTTEADSMLAEAAGMEIVDGRVTLVSPVRDGNIVSSGSPCVGTRQG